MLPLLAPWYVTEVRDKMNIDELHKLHRNNSNDKKTAEKTIPVKIIHACSVYIRLNSPSLPATNQAFIFSKRNSA